ncbi:MAG: tetratricopeptide repeat protein [Lewinellaceae bacterium]|nr:tetratricopeptide repeat protein [Lewinellaceae bacterium]
MKNQALNLCFSLCLGSWLFICISAKLQAQCTELNKKVDDLIEANDMTGLVELADEALKVCKTEFGANSEEFAQALMNRAAVYSFSSSQDSTYVYLLEAKRIIDQIGQDTSKGYGALLNNLVLCYNSRGEFRKAANLQLRVLKMAERSFGKKSFEYANRQNGLCMSYIFLGKLDSALFYGQAAVELIRELKGKNHIYYLMYSANLIVVYEKLGYPSKVGQFKG